MEATGLVLLSLLAVVVSGFLSRLSHLPVPLVQMALGAAIAQSSLRSVVLEPEAFFLLFLPPLLFLDGWRMPRDALRREAPAILKLALGLVLVTVLGLGAFIHWLIPAMPLPVAFALAAAISPTDPLAVSAIAARTPLPRRLMQMLQGEALFNDASGLVCMRLAVAAALTGSFSLGHALADFAWVALGGLAVGAGITVGVARGAAWASERWGEDGGAQILITLLLPFGVYLLAERLHCSGILAAVAAGVTMSFTDAWPWRAAIRLRRAAVWDTVALAAHGSVFVLLGEQLPALLAAAPLALQASTHHPLAWLAGLVGAIVVALGGLRFAWVWVSLVIDAWVLRRRGHPAALPGARLVLVATLAGVRGAVTLAGVLTLPLALHDGTPFPTRELAVLLAAGVLVLSMLLAMAALPATLRGLVLPAEPPRHAALERLRQAGAQAAVQAIEEAQRELAGSAAASPQGAEVAARIVELYRERMQRDGDAASPALRLQDRALEQRFRLAGLRAERAAVLQHGREHAIDELALRALVRDIDHQESRYAA